MGGKKFESGKKFGRKNSLVGKFVGQINFCPQKICGWKKILFRKNFGETFFEWKKILVKKIWSENNFGLREYFVGKMFCQRKNWVGKKF